jgi:hypothetical protein
MKSKFDEYTATQAIASLANVSVSYFPAIVLIFILESWFMINSDGLVDIYDFIQIGRNFNEVSDICPRPDSTPKFL